MKFCVAKRLAAQVDLSILGTDVTLDLRRDETGIIGALWAFESVEAAEAWFGEGVEVFWMEIDEAAL